MKRADQLRQEIQSELVKYEAQSMEDKLVVISTVYLRAIVDLQETVDRLEYLLNQRAR